MQLFNALRRPTVVAVAALCLSCLASLCVAAGNSVVPDVLDLAAQQNNRAQQGLILAVAQAGQRLVAVGERGSVLLSDDAGRSWRQARSVPVSVLLTDVDFPTPTQGWAVGHSGVILHSADGGETWQRQLDGLAAAQVILDDARQRAAAGQEGAAAAVRSAGFLVSDGPDKPFLSVRFSDQKHGYVVGAYGIALTTDDGGQSWQSLVGRIPNPRGKHLYQVRINRQQLLIAGEQGVLFRSEDAGGHFSEITTPYKGTFFGVMSLEGDALLAYGLRGNAWRSPDNGSSWQRVAPEQSVTLSDARALRDGSLLLADESGRLLRSTDGGRSFVAFKTQTQAGLSGVVESQDAALIMFGARGLSRIELGTLVSGVQP